MIRGLYAAASGSIAHETRLATVTNNIANVQTTGYKQDKMANAGFYEMLVSRLSSSELDPIAGTELGVVSTATGTGEATIDFSQGPLVDTGRALDLALSGPGFLAVQTPEGVRYTRFGSLQANADGVLVQPDGNPVLGVDGPIRLGPGAVRVSDGGAIFVDGQPTGRLRIVEIPPEVVAKAGENYFEALDPAAVQDARGTAVNQGYLEGSNVDVTRSMVELMEIIRSYSATQKVLQMQDQVLASTVNEVGKIG